MRTRRREARDESSETARREQCCARCHRTAASHEAASHESAPHESAHEASSHEAAVHGGTRRRRTASSHCGVARRASKTCPSRCRACARIRVLIAALIGHFIGKLLQKWKPLQKASTRRLWSEKTTRRRRPLCRNGSGAVLVHLEGTLGVLWSTLGALWGRFGALWARFGGALERIEAQKGGEIEGRRRNGGIQSRLIKWDQIQTRFLQKRRLRKSFIKPNESRQIPRF